MRLTTVGKLAAVCAALALGAVGAAPVSVGAAPTSGVDTVNVTGSSSSEYSNINITAQSESGDYPTGTASFRIFGLLDISGRVTCLRVTGPGRGGGTPGAPTTAVLQVDGVTMELVDNGGGGADRIGSFPLDRSSLDCSPIRAGETLVSDVLTNGRAIVFDAPPVPTSEAQCKNGGYAQFGFKNQGQCVASVPAIPRPASTIGLDTVRATGATSTQVYFNIDITAQSGTSGENPTGTVSLRVGRGFPVDGRVTCLRVTGPGQGGGTPEAPTTATLNSQDRVSGGIFTVEFVDNGGGGADLMKTSSGRLRN